MNPLYEIRYLKSAEKDLYDIFDYIKLDNPSAAGSLLDKIDDSIALLASNPKMGKIPKNRYIRDKGYRMLIVENYLVFYVLKEKIIQIRRILHSARNYEFLL